MKTIVGFIFATFVVATIAMELPNNFKICKKTDPQYTACMNKAIADAVVTLSSGLKSFKILPIEPLVVDVVKIGEGQGPVSLKQEYHNIKLHGLTKGLQIKNFRFDWDNLVLRSEAYNPQVDFVADYKLDGQVLVLPIKGAGHSNISMFDLKSQNTIFCEKFEKGGETYLKARKYNIKFLPGKVSLQFDNLFDGDKALGDQMNKFLNENSELIFKELQGPYEETFGLVFAKISNDIFSRVPMNKLFP